MSGLKDVAQAYADKQFKATVARTKFRNVKTEVDGHTFDSKLEAQRYRELSVMEKAGMIRSLELQRQFAITVNDYPVCTYIADFVYEMGTGGAWRRVVEDAKGMRTAVYILKKKLMKAALGIEILETRKGRTK